MFHIIIIHISLFIILSNLIISIVSFVIVVIMVCIIMMMLIFISLCPCHVPGLGAIFPAISIGGRATGNFVAC